MTRESSRLEAPKLLFLCPTRARSPWKSAEFPTFAHCASICTVLQSLIGVKDCPSHQQGGFHHVTQTHTRRKISGQQHGGRRTGRPEATYLRCRSIPHCRGRCSRRSSFREQA